MPGGKQSRGESSAAIPQIPADSDALLDRQVVTLSGRQRAQIHGPTATAASYLSDLAQAIQVANFDTSSVNQPNYAVCSQLAKSSANSFNRHAKKIGNLQSRKRKMKYLAIFSISCMSTAIILSVPQP